MNESVTIYLVDHDRSARKGISNLLIAAGYSVEAFSTLEDFLQFRPIEERSCMIMDTQVPGLTKINLLSEFKQKSILIPVVFLAAKNEKASRKIAIKAKGVVFFRKPVDGPALLDAVSWGIETHISKYS